jgi:hypothetical protein
VTTFNLFMYNCPPLGLVGDVIVCVLFAFAVCNRLLICGECFNELSNNRSNKLFLMTFNISLVNFKRLKADYPHSDRF